MLTKLTLSASIVLYKTIIKILFTEDQKERDLPFNIRYKLQRCLEMLEKDALFFENKRVELVKTFGDPQEDGTIKVLEDKLEDFNKEASNLLAMEVSHDFIRLTPEEALSITVDGISHDEMTLFIAAMINDPELEADMKEPIENINNGEAAANSTETGPANE